MNSHEVEPVELMAFLDGELPSARSAAVAAHLNNCPECRVAIAESRALAKRLTAWQVEGAPASLTTSVMAAANAAGVKPKDQVFSRASFRWFALPKWVWVAAGGGCLLLLGAVWITSMRRSPEQIMTYMPPSAAREAPVPAPSAAADSVEALANLAQNRVRVEAGFGGGGSEAPPMAPMIARTASLTLVSKDFEVTRAALETIIRRHRGYSAQLTVSNQAGSTHALSASFRVPADQLDAVLAEIKQLGQVQQESQGGEEVTAQYVDLQARLSNARRTEQTLLEILQKRTGQLADVLAVEQELSRVREQIERMEAEMKNLQNRVSFATLQVELHEEYKAQLQIPPSLRGRLRNALVEGFRTATDSLVGVVMFLASVGPFVLLWLIILFWPARYIWRRLRVSEAKK